MNKKNKEALVELLTGIHETLKAVHQQMATPTTGKGEAVNEEKQSEIATTSAARPAGSGVDSLLARAQFYMGEAAIALDQYMHSTEKKAHPLDAIPDGTVVYGLSSYKVKINGQFVKCSSYTIVMDLLNNNCKKHEIL